MSREDYTPIAMPRSFQNRLSSVGSYVRTLVDEEEIHLPKKSRMNAAEIQTIKHVVFLYVLNRFFIEGSKAAKIAVDEFAKHGVQEFSVGSTRFTGRNENVMIGETLSTCLKEMCASLGLGDILDGSYTIRNLTLDLMKRIKDGKTMDRTRSLEE